MTLITIFIADLLILNLENDKQPVEITKIYGALSANFTKKII